MLCASHVRLLLVSSHGLDREASVRPRSGACLRRRGAAVLRSNGLRESTRQPRRATCDRSEPSVAGDGRPGRPDSARAGRTRPTAATGPGGTNLYGTRVRCRSSVCFRDFQLSGGHGRAGGSGACALRSVAVRCGFGAGPASQGTPVSASRHRPFDGSSL